MSRSRVCVCVLVVFLISGCSIPLIPVESEELEIRYYPEEPECWGLYIDEAFYYINEQQALDIVTVILFAPGPGKYTIHLSFIPESNCMFFIDEFTKEMIVNNEFSPL